MDASLAGTLFKMVTALGAVLLVFAACVWVFKKAQAKIGTSKGKVGKASTFEVISFFTIGPQKTLYMVRVEDRKLLLGVTNQSISLLTDWDDFDSSSGGAFRSSGAPATEIKDSASFAKELESSFKGMSRV
ncbi:MAG TPA: flagellar biosynthetic protein FliO [Bdellovibrionota bacterium]|jgi:flagellar biosynthetic protein FliO|nr:flagellar biosynthetic protein FliO [Bdellovibrionota bacterium]